MRQVTTTVVFVADYAHVIEVVVYLLHPWQVLEPLRRVCSLLVRLAALCHIQQMVVTPAQENETLVEIEILLLSMRPCRLHHASRHG